MRAALFVPGPFDTVSGGYVYDRHIAAGLRAIGHAVAVIELAGRHPLADAAAHDSAAAAWAGLDPAVVPVIDGLGLPAFAPLAERLAWHGAVGLIHHPTALETGAPETVRAQLREVEAMLLPLLRRVIVTSEETAERLAAGFGVDRERIAVIVPGTEDAPRAAGSAGQGPCRILAIGTLIPRKGHDVLLRALAALRDLDWRLTIVGGAARDPAHAQALAALAEALGIAARVEFAGELAGPPLDALWRGADLFALATHYEGYGMVIAEALKRGLPVAVTAGGAAGALVSPDSGIVCSAGDAETLSKGLRRLIFDRPLREAMRAAAWRAGQDLPDWPTQAQAFAAALAA